MKENVVNQCKHCTVGCIQQSAHDTWLDTRSNLFHFASNYLLT